ncbi:MAG: hypothetical protein KBT53_02565 [Porticoccus sp.]|nr:hypothetical protein [Porticoccus sp.]MBQ0807370.1 hypothetical protein [Porticoccus sp.]
MGFSQKATLAVLLVVCLPSFALADSPTTGEELDTEGHETTSASAVPLTRDLDVSLILENYHAAIEKKEIELGPYDLELSEMTYSLGRILQANLQYNEAIHAYKQSLHLQRVNNGVYSLSQAPMLRGLAESNEKQGSIREASENYEKLLWIHLKTYGRNNARLIPLLDEIGQWHLDTYATSRQREDGYHISTAFDLYATAIELTTQHHGPSNLELINPLRKMAITSYYFALHQSLYPKFSEFGSLKPFGYRPLGTGTTSAYMLGRGSHYTRGRKAHNQILEILSNNTQVAPSDKAKSYADFGDWYLLFGHQKQAIQAYEKAHQIIEGDTQKQVVLNNLFGEPIMLPKRENQPSTRATSSTKTMADDSNPVAPAHTTTFDSYIDLSVDVTPQGRATNIKVKKVYPKEASEFESRATNIIHSRKFRPRFESGLPVLTNAFPVRVLIPNENS